MRLVTALRTVRIWQANINARIVAHVPMRDGAVVEEGDFELDGVTFPAAEVKIEFLDPSGEERRRGRHVPYRQRLGPARRVPGVGPVELTMINAGNPAIFVDAATLGLNGNELQGGRERQRRTAEKSRGHPLERCCSHGTCALGGGSHHIASSHAQARVRCKAARLCIFERQGDRYLIDRHQCADFLDGQAAPRHDRYGRRCDRGSRGYPGDAGEPSCIDCRRFSAFPDILRAACRSVPRRSKQMASGLSQKP